VVLPAGAGSWTGERLASVLTHELAHVRRRDVLSQSAAYAVCALFWFVPPLWLAYGALLREAEKSCDQHVIDRGIRGPRYARSILDLAHSSRRMLLPCLSAAVGHRSMLIQRIRGILALRPAERPFGPRDAAKVLAVCLCCLLPALVVFAGAQEPGIPASDPLFGTWINEEWDVSSRFKPAKVVFEPDGHEWNYRHIGDTDPMFEGWNTVTRSWVDRSGVRWYRVRAVGWSLPGQHGKFDGYHLIRISPDGNTMESCFAQYDYPPDVQPLGPCYAVQYRQK
jgi:hypothetical protein